jgi:hypothetical protein
MFAISSADRLFADANSRSQRAGERRICGGLGERLSLALAWPFRPTLSPTLLSLVRVVERHCLRGASEARGSGLKLRAVGLKGRRTAPRTNRKTPKMYAVVWPQCRSRSIACAWHEAVNDRFWVERSAGATGIPDDPFLSIPFSAPTQSPCPLASVVPSPR